MSEESPRRVGADFTTAVFARIAVDRYTVADSVIGPVFVGWNARGVCAVRRADVAGAFAAWYTRRTGRPIVAARELDTIARAAQGRIGGSEDAVPLDLTGVEPFERSVFAAVDRIERGYARPCELVAGDLLGRSDTRAVEAVLADNPLPLLIPCHRVIRADGCCAGRYVFGPDAQSRLLAAEGIDPALIDRLTAEGVRYIGSDGYFCLPTCGDIALRADRPGYLRLRSLAEAHAHGLQACASCRPVAA